MSEHFDILVPGATGNGGLLEVTAPYDGSPIGSVTTAGAADVERALATAHARYRDRAGWLSGARRMAVLEKTAALMTAAAETLALEAAREGGKPLADSRVEVARAIDGMKNCTELLRHEGGGEVPMGIDAASAGRLAFTHREPMGVVVAISAFNHPLNLIVHQVGPAIAAGCPVIVKPAEDTPLSCMRLVTLLRQAGLPEAWCQALVVDDTALAEGLATDPRVGFLSFIGSGRVGWTLRSRLAPGTRCALEHGGAAPVIIAADADLDDALPLVAKAGLYHAGQVCVSVQRVYAHESIFDGVVAGLAAEAAAMVVGDPTREDTDIGPLIRPAEVDRVEEWVREAAAGGGTIATGGDRLSDTCFAPTIVAGPDPSARLSREEIFGPVIAIYPYRDLEQAMTTANDLPFAFQAAVFTRDIDTAMAAYGGLDASAVMINDHTAFRVDWMPFAGLRQSGLGVGGIPYTYRDMTVEKMMVIRSPAL
ncbi:MAG: aldehyde dehydrogenase family protein [Gammaproteobacteria bacterium]|nr:aldehyde dehydrogenase family protein [Gammaproteobacteria bacterium]